MTTAPDKDPQPAMFAIVELFGHQRVAGRISEQSFGGDSFVRVDVPEVSFEERDYGDERLQTRVIQAHTRTFGAKAIYAINWCDEQTAAIRSR